MVERDRTGRARGWVFTINNYTEEQEEWIRTRAMRKGNLKCLVVGKEIGGQEGTPHLQGYLVGNNAKAMSAVKKLLAPTRNMTAAHVEWARGTPMQCAAYCRKDDDMLIDEGELPKKIGGQRGHAQIARTKENPDGLNAKLLAFQMDARRGMKATGLWEKHGGVMIRYKSGCQSMIANYMAAKTKPKPKIFICWGKTGTGKSHWVEESFGRNPTKVYWVQARPGKTWWNGYEQQPVIVFDDFEPRFMDSGEFKLLVDKYSYRVEPKGEQLPMVSKYIIFTTNDDPKEWYRNKEITEEHEDEHYLSVQRRIEDGVMHFLKKYDENDNDYHCGHLPHRPLELAEVKPEIIDLTGDTEEDEQEDWQSLDLHVQDYDGDDEDEEDDDDDNDDEAMESLARQESERRPPHKKRRLTHCKYVDMEAGCNDDDDEEDEWAQAQSYHNF